MRIITILIYFLSLQQVLSVVVAAEPKKSNSKPSIKSSAGSCSQEDINQFKQAYVDLQNALKFEGQNIELKNGKAKATGEVVAQDYSKGQNVEEALYNQYKNALIKVGKIYQQINKDPTDASAKLLNDNPDLAKFFKAIEPGNTDKKSADNINFDSLVEKLKNIKIKDFELNDEDIYLLKNLLIHSQDRICTLEQYKKSKNTSKTAYLEQLKKSPLNKMIESLKSLDKNNPLNLANENIAISQAVKDSMKNLRNIVLKNKSCEIKLMNSPLLGDVVQTCNYNKFIKSISANNFNEIESILHFLNANQKSKFAPTGLDWINTQFSEVAKASCLRDPKNNTVYVQNLPFKGKNIDTSKLSCSKGTINLKPEECIKGLSFEFENDLGMKVSPKKMAGTDSPITAFSIAGSDTTCTNVALSNQPEALPPIKPLPQVKPNVPPVEALKVCDQKSCETEVAGESRSWLDSEKACYTQKLGKESVKLCSSTDVPLMTEAECIKDPKKEWKDEKCLDKTTAPLMTEAECIKDPKKEWKDAKCIAKVALTGQAKCDKAQSDWEDADKSENRFNRYTWDEEKKVCKDKQASKADNKQDDPADSKPDAVYPNKPVPGRFQPITIPTRQIYILPGMP